jgi:hypothetical protein
MMMMLAMMVMMVVMRSVQESIHRHRQCETEIRVLALASLVSLNELQSSLSREADASIHSFIHSFIIIVFF